MRDSSAFADSSSAVRAGICCSAPLGHSTRAPTTAIAPPAATRTTRSSAASQSDRWVRSMSIMISGVLQTDQ
ncbi:hypothetical protein BJF79_09360 [Actinomadura sp. CNU-125]|uniref:hypothetical protein n=1 Tax=Actinomadura sp. CNU-125 TaxID=1904961 RepID=UPI00095DED9C|nr:hypothetical protein [Actinomadura sp. CNU-125]OLT30794.1 hypothetical protein BJF79_09360 [Actinomadura sp. CNU-125]